MASFHQMGHDSENLVLDKSLTSLSGAILSPLNYEPSRVAQQLKKLSDRPNFYTILDPHLYRPKSDRMCLPEWSYYPKDVETTDFNSGWWSGIVKCLAQVALDLGPSAVASPAMVPKSFPDEYYMDLLSYGDELQAILDNSSVTPMQTVIARISDLTSFSRVMEIASIISQSKSSDLLLVLIADAEPRRELSDPEELKGAMRLISALEANGQRVTVSSCSSEVVLWKAAGATNCATGKFFNLRRFTLSRFDEPTAAGGGQLPYFFEENLLAFLRQSDVLRVQQKDLISDVSKSNPFTAEIFLAIQNNKPWLALSWRHFLHWFGDLESRLTSGSSMASDMITTADDNWGLLESSKPAVYMEERQNNGAWVRQWRRAVEEYPFEE